MTLAIKRTGPSSDLPVVLIHAMPLDGSMWDEVRVRMDGIDVVTVDVPGFGASPSGEEVQAELGASKISLDVVVDALARTLDAEGIDRVVIGGVSMGGAVAAGFARVYPDRVAGLALMDTNIATDTPEHREMRLGTIEGFLHGDTYEVLNGWMPGLLAPGASAEAREWLDGRLREVSGESMAWLQEAMANRSDSTEALRGAHYPILLMRGAEDPSCCLEQLQEWKGIAPQARIVEVPGAGHFVANEQPELVALELVELYMQAAVAF